MALTTDTWTVYGDAGNTILNSIREDLADFIENIDPSDTPLFSMIGTVPAAQVKHEWLEDTLAAVDSSGALEGDVFAPDQLTTMTRLLNYTQIFRKDIRVSGTNQVVDHAGLADQLGYQVMKALKEISRNTEAAMLQNGAASAGFFTAARTMRGLTNWAGTSEAVTTNELLEADFLALAGDMWDLGANPDTVLADKDAKIDITNLVTSGGGNRILRHNVDPNTLVANVLEYEHDFGKVNVYLERYGVNTESYLFEKDRLKKAVLRPIQVVPIAKTADAEDVMVLHEMTLECRTADAVGKWTGLPA